MYDVHCPNLVDNGDCGNIKCGGDSNACGLPCDVHEGRIRNRPCWMASFKWHLNEAAVQGGLMLQVVEDRGKGPELGKGQNIEAEMAKELGMRVIRVDVPTSGKSHAELVKKCGEEPVIWFQRQFLMRDGVEQRSIESLIESGSAKRVRELRGSIESRR